MGNFCATFSLCGCFVPKLDDDDDYVVASSFPDSYTSRRRGGQTTPTSHFRATSPSVFTITSPASMYATRSFSTLSSTLSSITSLNAPPRRLLLEPAALNDFRLFSEMSQLQMLDDSRRHFSVDSGYCSSQYASQWSSATSSARTTPRCSSIFDFEVNDCTITSTLDHRVPSFAPLATITPPSSPLLDIFNRSIDSWSSKTMRRLRASMRKFAWIDEIKQCLATSTSTPVTVSAICDSNPATRFDTSSVKGAVASSLHTLQSKSKRAMRAIAPMCQVLLRVYDVNFF